MRASTGLKSLVLFVMPFTLAFVAGLFALLLGSSLANAAMKGGLTGVALCVAAWVDLARESSEEETEPSASTAFVIREVCAFTLPFALIAAWVVVVFGMEATFSLVHLVYPFAVGTLLGRAAIEYHYLRRTSKNDLFPVEAVFYHDDPPN